MKQTTIFRRLVMSLCALLMSTSLAIAQSSGDKLYNQGLQLQKTMTVKAQNSAIAKFSSAKKLYDSAAKKAQCDQAISVSRNIISSLKGGGGAGGRTGGRGRKSSAESREETHREETTLSLSNTAFDGVALSGGKLNVTVATNDNNWTVAPVVNADGSSYFTASRTDDQTICINVPANPRNGDREQDIIVTAGQLTKKIHVKQEGRKVRVLVSEQVFDFKEKGGDKKDVEIWSDSDITYDDNNGANWRVTDKPEWVRVSIQNKKEGGGFFKKLGSKVTDTAKGLLGKEEVDTEGMTKTYVIIHADAKPRKTDPSRSGTITLESGNTTVTLSVNQK